MDITYLETRAESVSARVLAEHERSVLVQAHQLSVHDFICLFVLQHAVLGQVHQSHHARNTV